MPHTLNRRVMNFKEWLLDIISSYTPNWIQITISIIITVITLAFAVALFLGLVYFFFMRLRPLFDTFTP